MYAELNWSPEVHHEHVGLIIREDTKDIAHIGEISEGASELAFIAAPFQKHEWDYNERNTSGVGEEPVGDTNDWHRSLLLLVNGEV